VAHRLQTVLRPGDTLARFGGDEFAIILGNCKSLPDVCLVADRLLEKLGFPFRIDDHDVLTSASIGVAIGSPYRKPEEILSDADIAMYRAKLAEGVLRGLPVAKGPGARFSLRIFNWHLIRPSGPLSDYRNKHRDCMLQCHQMVPSARVCVAGWGLVDTAKAPTQAPD
jgi:GGDEF domain-containing protein